MIVSRNVTGAAPSVHGSSEDSSTRIIEAVIFDKNELLAAVIGRLRPRTVSIIPSAPVRHVNVNRLRAVSGSVIKQVVIYHALDGSPYSDIVVLEQHVVEVVVVDTNSMRIAVHLKHTVEIHSTDSARPQRNSTHAVR